MNNFSESYHNYGNTKSAKKYQKSGKNNPCPICNRTKDADCSWNDEVVLCHTRAKDGITAETGYIYRGIEWNEWRDQAIFFPIDSNSQSFKPSKKPSKPKSSKKPSKPLDIEAFNGGVATVETPIGRYPIPKGVTKPKDAPNQSVLTAYPDRLCDWRVFANSHVTLDDIKQSINESGYGCHLRADYLLGGIEHSIDNSIYIDIDTFTRSVSKSQRDKVFSYWHTTDKKTFVNKKGDKCWLPYQFNQILASYEQGINTGKVLPIVEGQKCVDSLSQKGVMGTSFISWTEEEIEAGLRCFKLGGIPGSPFFCDNDDDGYQKKGLKVKEIADKIGYPLVLIPMTFLWEDCPEKGDLADYIMEFPDMTNDELMKRLNEEIKHAVEVENQRILLESLKTEVTERNITLDDDEDGETKSKTSWDEKAYNECFGDDKWITLLGKMHRYNGKYYEPVEDVTIHRKVSLFLQERYPEQASSANLIKLLSWAKYKTGVVPNKVNKSGINLSNGVLEIQWDGKVPKPVLVAHDSSLIYTYCSEVSYNPNADNSDCEKLLECLDPEYRDIFLKLIGASLDLQTVRKYRGRIRAILLLGEGSNGKDALREVVKVMLGNVGMTSCSFMDFKQYDSGRKFPLAILGVNPKINWSSENTDSVKLDNLESLKRAITGEEIDIEKKGRDGASVNLACLCIFNGNKAPKLGGELEAIKSRYTVFPFTKVYTSNPDLSKGELQADPRFKYDPLFIIEKVAPAFLNKVIDGLIRLMTEGINYDCTQKTIEAIQCESNHLHRFCKDVGLVYDPNGQVSVKDIWDKLEQWYLQDGTLEIDESGNKPKRIWYDLPKGDKAIKAPNQIGSRFSELFPKGRIIVEGGTNKRIFLVGLKRETKRDKGIMFTM